MSDPVRLAIDQGVATITLDRPPLNLFDVDMRDALIGAVTAARDIDDVRAVVLRASGPNLGAGADLSEFGGADHIVEARRIRWDRDAWGPLIDLPVPTLATISGIALGSALEMSLLCDVRLCGADARLGLPETRLGMLPAAGGTQSSTATIGAHAALPFVALGDTITADEAYDRGLVHQVVGNDRLDDEIRTIVTAWTQLPRAHWRTARRLIRAAVDLPLDAGLAVERRLATNAATG